MFNKQEAGIVPISVVNVAHILESADANGVAVTRKLIGRNEIYRDETTTDGTHIIHAAIDFMPVSNQPETQTQPKSENVEDARSRMYVLVSQVFQLINNS